MDIVTLIVVAVLGIVALLLVAYPLWQQTRPEAVFSVNRTGQTLEEYQARYQAALVAITDLMFDHEMGKVSTEDYEALLAQSKLEAAELRQAIDRLSQNSSPENIDAALDTELELLIDQMRRSPAANHQALQHAVNAEIELLKDVQFEPNRREEPLCPACGHLILDDDAFCSGCGRSLAGTEPAAAPQAANVCSRCGHLVRPDDAFCAGCGAALVTDSPASGVKDASRS